MSKPPSLPDKPSEAAQAPLDALASILPGQGSLASGRCLTQEDRATLRHLAADGMGANSLRAIASDLNYLEAWCSAATGEPLPWPAPLDLVLKFVAHHLWDSEERLRDPRHGMPAEVMEEMRALGLLRSKGPHAPATVRRRLSSWSTLHAWRNVQGPFGTAALKKAVGMAVRAARRPRRRKSPEAITRDVLSRVLQPMDAALEEGGLARAAQLACLRDRALLTLAFASGGRRRSEVAGLQIDQLERGQVDLGQEAAAAEPVLKLHLGRTKTTDADDDAAVFIAGRAIADLDAWTSAARIGVGSVFRRVDRWGNVSALALTPQSVNRIVKERVRAAGLDPKRFSAHGLRSGFLTEAALQGLSLPEAMSQSGHRSVQQAASYFRPVEAARSRAARLLD